MRSAGYIFGGSELYIECLNLDRFRNYKSLHIDLSPGCNVFYGKNAQGKTNIIEAIFLCAVGRSHRTSKDNELVMIGEGTYRVMLDVAKENIKNSVCISFDLQQGKRIDVNEIPLKRMVDLIGNVNAVIFSPEEIMMIKQGPFERRRFTDMTISQIKPSYFRDLQRYSHLLKQRNILLKDIQLGNSKGEELPVWNDTLASTGARIIYERREFIKRISNKVQENHLKLTDGKESLTILYAPSFETDGKMDISEIEKEFKRILSETQPREIQRGITLYGPQRDDFEFILDGISLKLYGSQGQQRTAILSVKISEIEIMFEETGEMPVLLLDDVMSELDESRQKYLFENIGKIQTIITCTDKEKFKNEENARIFFVNKGTVKIEE
jgi:DNA replication and repair protein RecF